MTKSRRWIRTVRMQTMSGVVVGAVGIFVLMVGIIVMIYDGELVPPPPINPDPNSFFEMFHSFGYETPIAVNWLFFITLATTLLAIAYLMWQNTMGGLIHRCSVERRHQGLVKHREIVRRRKLRFLNIDQP